jgi:hypothetical protein
MIERRGTPVILDDGVRPTVAAAWRAMLGCGCAIYVGRRVDNDEVATGAVPCSSEHRRLVNHATLLMRESLTEPSDELLVEVADRLLSEAERWWKP